MVQHTEKAVVVDLNIKSDAAKTTDHVVYISKLDNGKRGLFLKVFLEDKQTD